MGFRESSEDSPRPRPARLSIASTALALSCALGLAAALPACRAFNNDWRDRRAAPDSSYDPQLAAGSSSRDLLAPAPFRSLVVEIGAVHGHAPTQEALNRLQRFLEARLDKPRGVSIVIGDELPPSKGGDGAYSVADLRRLERDYRRQRTEKDRMTVYLLFLDGRSVDDQGESRLLGQAFHNTSIALFEKSLRAEAAKAPGLPTWLVESTVIQHEFGHLLGLVGGLSADQARHADEAHPGHCANPQCLMYHATETPAVMQALLMSGKMPSLDAECLADLKAAGGK